MPISYKGAAAVSSIQIEQNGRNRTIPLPAGETLLSILRCAGYSIPAACGGKGRCGKCRVPVNGVPRLACRVYPEDGDTVTLPEAAGGAILTGTVPLPACQPGRTGCGAAVDLGTTTVVVRLYDLASGTELATGSGWNAQAPYGADVISRIQYTLEQPDGLQELSQRIREQIWALVSGALTRSGRAPDALHEITLAGNTVMQHLFAGYSVRGIAAAPFRPETLFEAPGAETLHSVPVHFAPCVAGYVGGGHYGRSAGRRTGRSAGSQTCFSTSAPTVKWRSAGATDLSAAPWRPAQPSRARASRAVCRVWTAPSVACGMTTAFCTTSSEAANRRGCAAPACST